MHTGHRAALSPEWHNATVFVVTRKPQSVSDLQTPQTTMMDDTMPRSYAFITLAVRNFQPMIYDQVHYTDLERGKMLANDSTTQLLAPFPQLET